MIYDINLNIGEKHVGFVMDLDGGDLRDHAMLSHLQQNLVPEPEVVHVMWRAVRAGDVVLDGGANVGYFTLLLSRLVGPSGKVIAVEPSPPNLAKLRRNLALNHVDNVEVVSKALWSESGKTLDFHLTHRGGYDSLTRGDTTIATTQVETISLDDLAPKELFRLIKLDLEGAEFETLEPEPLRVADFVIVEAQDRFASPLRDRMAQRGYDTYVMHHDGSLPSRIPDGCRLLPKADNSNLLFGWEDKLAEAWPEVLY